MDKKAQIYILAALFLILVIFGLVVQVNRVRRDFIEDDFEELSDDYARESSRFVNYLTGEGVSGENFVEKYLEFTVDFTRYTKAQNPDFGLIYLFHSGLGEESKLHVGNYLDQPIIVGVCEVDDGCFEDVINELLENENSGKAVLLQGCQSKIGTKFDFEGFGSGQGGVEIGDISECNSTLAPPEGGEYNLVFLMGDVAYQTNVVSGVTDVVIVSHEAKNEQRKIFLNDKFITGEFKNIIEDLCKQEERCERGDCFKDLCKCDRPGRGHGEGQPQKRKEKCEMNRYCKWDEENQKCCNTEEGCGD